MCIEMITDRIGSCYQSLSNNLAPEQAFSARDPVMCPSERKNIRTLSVSVEDLLIPSQMAHSDVCCIAVLMQ